MSHTPSNLLNRASSVPRLPMAWDVQLCFWAAAPGIAYEFLHVLLRRMPQSVRGHSYHHVDVWFASGFLCAQLSPSPSYARRMPCLWGFDLWFSPPKFGAGGSRSFPQDLLCAWDIYSAGPWNSANQTQQSSVIRLLRMRSFILP